MRHRMIRQKGLALLIVIFALPLLATELAVLGTVSSTLMHQADAQYVQAVHNNLTASALAWTKLHLKATDLRKAGGTIDFDPNDLDVKRANLSVTVMELDRDKASVRIDASCSKGRQTIHKKKSYRLTI